MKILIAEDDSVSRLALEILLKKLGHTVAACEDGSVAWQAFEQGDYCCVISDWVMPEIDGLELCRMIRESNRREYCYFIMLTTKAAKEDFVAAITAGADDYITKPLNKEDVAGRLRLAERVLERMQFRRQA